MTTRATSAGSSRLAGPSWAAAVGLLSAATGITASVAPIVLVGLLGLAVSVGVFLAYPAFALLAIVLVRASLDQSDFLFSIGGTNLAGFIGVAVAAGGGLALLLARPKEAPRLVALPFLGLVVLALVSLAYTPAAGEGVRTWLRLAALLVLFCLAARVVRDVRGLRRTAGFVLAAATLPVLVGLFQAATGSTSVKQGFASISGTFVHANGYAFFLLVVLTLGTVMLLERALPPARAAALAVLLLAAGACFLLTYARAAWIGAVVVLCLLAALEYRRLIAVCALAVVLAVLAVPSGLGQVQARFSDLSADSANYSDNSFSWRVATWEQMLPYALDRPLTGHGLSSYQPLSVAEFGISEEIGTSLEDGGIYAHNDYLNLAVELGIFGVLLWLATLVGLAVLLWRARENEPVRPYATAMFALVVALTLMSASDNILSYTGLLYYVMVLCGAVLGAARASSHAGLPGAPVEEAATAVGAGASSERRDH